MWLKPNKYYMGGRAAPWYSQHKAGNTASQIFQYSLPLEKLQFLIYARSFTKFHVGVWSEILIICSIIISTRFFNEKYFVLNDQIFFLY